MAAIPLYEDVEVSLAAVLEAFLEAVAAPLVEASSPLFSLDSEGDARPDPCGAPIACVSALAACVEAAARLGSADHVHAAFQRVTTHLRARRGPMPERLARAFIVGLAADGLRPNAALDAASTCVELGSRLSEVAVLPVIEAGSSRDDLERAFVALRLMAASGTQPTVRTETALLDLCVRVSLSNLPVPPSLVEAARREAEIAEAVQRAVDGAQRSGSVLSPPSPAEDALDAALGAPRGVGDGHDTRGLLPAAARHDKPRVVDVEVIGSADEGTLPPAASAAALSTPHRSSQALQHPAPSLSPVEKLIRRYSVFNDTEVGRAIIAVLRGRLFPPPPAAAPPPSGAASLAHAARTARALCTGIIRGAVQIVAAEAREVALAPGQELAGAGPDSRDGSSDDGDALDVSREMLSLALHEWPTPQAAYDGREAHLAAATPQGRAAAMRRARPEAAAARSEATDELVRATAPGAPPPTYRTFESMLRASLCFGDFLAQLRARRSPLDPSSEARHQAHERGGLLQRLPRAYGGFMLVKRLCPDEDGSGMLGREPVFPSAVLPLPQSGRRRRAEEGLSLSPRAAGGARRGEEEPLPPVLPESWDERSFLWPAAMADGDRGGEDAHSLASAVPPSLQ